MEVEGDDDGGEADRAAVILAAARGGGASGAVRAAGEALGVATPTLYTTLRARLAEDARTAFDEALEDGRLVEAHPPVAFRPPQPFLRPSTPRRLTSNVLILRKKIAFEYKRNGPSLDFGTPLPPNRHIVALLSRVSETNAISDADVQHERRTTVAGSP